MAGCATCHDLRRQPKDYRYVLDIGYQDLCDSATSGCWYCSVLHKGVSAFVPNASNVVQHITVLGAPVDDDQHLLRVEIKRNSQKPYILEFFQDSSDESPDSNFRRGQRIPGNTADPRSFDFLHRQFQDCLKSHIECRRYSRYYMPKRLLDVGTATEGYSIKLADDVDFVQPYACLSHRWGQVRHLVTDTTTIEAHKKSIRIEDLPRTFQDAVLLTRKLGIRYLWIDSLAIIQDSSQDWTEQSAQMKAIFQNAYITIAATHSGDDSSGCFSPAQSTMSEQCISSPNMPNIYVREHVTHWDLTKKHPDLTHFPLLQRAWVYQERLLSPRVVHFCKTEIVWECIKRLHCECSFFQPGSASKEVRKSELSMATDNSQSSGWQQVVESYSRLQLTKATDKLPAIAGLASEFKSLGLRETYVAGLWREHLWSDLTWTCQEPQTSRPHCRAPTWSWASVDGTISFNTPVPPAINDDERAWEDVQSSSRVSEAPNRDRHPSPDLLERLDALERGTEFSPDLFDPQDTLEVERLLSPDLSGRQDAPERANPLGLYMSSRQKARERHRPYSRPEYRRRDVFERVGHFPVRDLRHRTKALGAGSHVILGERTVDATCVVRSEASPFGEVSSGELRIKSEAMLGTIDYSFDSPSAFFTGRTCERLPIHLDVLTNAESFGGQIVICVRVAGISFLVLRSVTRSEPEYRGPTDRVYKRIGIIHLDTSALGKTNLVRYIAMELEELEVVIV